MDMARNNNIRLKRQSPRSKVDWPEQQERRGSPRFNVSGESDSIRTIPAFLLVDISASGVGTKPIRFCPKNARHSSKIYFG